MVQEVKTRRWAGQETLTTRSSAEENSFENFELWEGA